MNIPNLNRHTYCQASQNQSLSISVFEQRTERKIISTTAQQWLYVMM